MDAGGGPRNRQGSVKKASRRVGAFFRFGKMCVGGEGVWMGMGRAWGMGVKHTCNMDGLFWYCVH